ncbi:M15 family metallopeptidase [Fusibacter sp. Q10-2]|uniref:M15 family metallopeptidase n=2 Tax=Fusibacter ferrireducens TaxID=2785058 RepID=A0ABR9ZQZ3_9FIRM|nr:M15 family metallopeptidase [Fusibacter ferrireducens]
MATAEVEFKIDEIDKTLYSQMLGKSFKENDVIQVEALRILTLTYYGFDESAHIGQLVVNQEVAEEVLEIFKVLYEKKYPIEKINLVDEYNADDDLSMADNNTSGFNFRVVSGSEHLSRHSYGMAIDINPVQNPYVTSKGVFPADGESYLDRSLKKKGMIDEEDLCYKLFTEKGWTWGGHFKSVKDYQHFQKAFKDDELNFKQ